MFKPPVTVRADNMGAIFIAGNITAIINNKHLVEWYKYENELAEDGIVKILFVESAENDNNILMMNLVGELHHKHSKKIIGANPK